MHEAGDVISGLNRRDGVLEKNDKIESITKKECFGTLLLNCDRAAYAELGITYIAYKYLSFSLLTVLTDHRIYNILTKKRHRLNDFI